ncbi:MAG: PEP/pyruvate-binding domain-containing protein [Bacilli bacterium]
MKKKDYLIFKKFKNKCDDFFENDEWKIRTLIETYKNDKLIQELKIYLDLDKNIKPSELDELLCELRKKTQSSFKEDIYLGMMYFGILESITELSSFSTQIIKDIKEKYKANYLEIITSLDKSYLSNDVKKIQKEIKYEIKDDLLNKYIVLKKWQDLQHSYYIEEIDPKVYELEVENNNNLYEYVEHPAFNVFMNQLSEKELIDINTASSLIEIGLSDGLIKLIGGKGYGLSMLNSKLIEIPYTVFVPVNSTKEIKLPDNRNYAVRSSADIEDGEKYSFAGLFDSYLDVKSNEINTYIEKVRESKHNDRLKKYLEKYELNDPNIAVVIQNYSEPSYAGVWIGKTMDTGYLEYVTGNGEKLVSGSVTPTSENWINKVENPLTINGIIVGKYLISLQKKLGCLADFEWMVLDNKIIMLQFRPVTVELNLNTVIEQDDSLIYGTSASSGIQEGRARFINARLMNQVYDWNKGDILMAWFTDPEWMNILVNSSAIVTAVGGFLCHSAIIARELGIPCVIGIGPQNMKKIWNDKELFVDGDNGYVRRIKR